MNLKARLGGEAAEATIEKLGRPDAWDVVGLIQDVEKRLEDAGDGEAGAVVGWLLSRAMSLRESLEDLLDSQIADNVDAAIRHARKSLESSKGL